jgi:predicted Zn-dependent protease
MAAWVVLVAMCAMPLSIIAQTQIKLHSNKYSPQQDIQLGREAAMQAEQKLQLLRDEELRRYVQRVGDRLVASIPPQFQHPEFRYSFKVVNAPDINAFALPGGPMYVNRGMIEAARNEGEMAGVMAHEISHVALRHGTAQATKAEKYSTLAGIAGIAGTILGGPQLGQLAAAPFSVYFLKYSREYETEADILGAQMMARAGYDPRDLANMFQTIERQSGGGGGGFFSDHPSPKDRYARINKEAQYLRVQNPIGDSREFALAQQRLRGYRGGAATGQISNAGQPMPSGNYPSSAPRGRVQPPSTNYQNVSIFDGGVDVSIPSNWRQINDQNSVWFVPEGAYGSYNGQSVFTHGVSFGAINVNNSGLQRGTDEIVNGLTQGNRDLRTSGGYQRTTMSGRNALLVTMANTNEATGQQELVRLITTQLQNGQLFYMIAVVPQNERSFEGAFRNVLSSLRLND